jgi:hypothetical protein
LISATAQITPVDSATKRKQLVRRTLYACLRNHGWWLRLAMEAAVRRIFSLSSRLSDELTGAIAEWRGNRGGKYDLFAD